MKEPGSQAFTLAFQQTGPQGDKTFLAPPHRPVLSVIQGSRPGRGLLRNPREQRRRGASKPLTEAS